MCNMSWKEKFLNISRNIFPCLALSKTSGKLDNQVKSNLPLQMAAYFNVIFLPVWIIVLTQFLIENYSKFSQLVQVLIVTIISTTFLIEVVRMYMMYEGNLNDKIPELAGFWMLSVFLQVPLQGVLLFNPYFKLRVLEIVCQSVIFVLLIIQIIFGYVGIKYTASQQAKYYSGKREELTKSKSDLNQRQKLF
ncbi:hypothetical protein ABEB36_014984 [Hypothenemus hampei]|uniref:Transmembrane protein 17 n=1 Tax=Hypothenemus hampei TaxID=57062 RepID=A0ABD1E1S2_HYPHA